MRVELNQCTTFERKKGKDEMESFILLVGWQKKSFFLLLSFRNPLLLCEVDNKIGASSFSSSSSPSSSFFPWKLATQNIRASSINDSYLPLNKCGFFTPGGNLVWQARRKKIFFFSRDELRLVQGHQGKALLTYHKGKVLR